jgi:predicted AAA+ superfamily ATPase
VVLINGSRQVGKSTLVGAKNLVGTRHYFTFDDNSVLAAAKRDPSGFVAGLSLPVTLDEVQHVPELFPAIKQTVDSARKPGQFLLTGSANVLLLPKLSESLAGRMEVLTLSPFSQGELAGIQEDFVDRLFSGAPPAPAQPRSALTREELFKRIIAGGYPPVIDRPQTDRRDAWFRAYLTTILQRDIRDLTQITDATAVPRLLSVLASRVGSLVNYAELSRSLGLPQTNLKRYFALLEAQSGEPSDPDAKGISQ